MVFVWVFFFWLMENVLNCCTFGEETVFFSPWRAASSSEPPLSWAFCGNTTASYLCIACFVGVFLEPRNLLSNSKPKQQALWATFLTWHVAKCLILPPPTPPSPQFGSQPYSFCFYTSLLQSLQRVLSLCLRIAGASQKDTVLMTFR